ncbi:MAG: exo-alpha-sialidase [Oscillospiraceae bacterium]|nr:exo-alpha-sialidase [Oscillospiraceae bacterium]
MKIITKKLIFDMGGGPTPSCHASTVAFFEGSLYAAWFGGRQEGANDVAIWLSIKEGDRWEIPKKMSVVENIPHWNPVLFCGGGKLFLYYKKGFEIPEWQTFYRVLEKGVWSGETELVPNDKGGRGPVKNKPVRLKNGLILAPASLESASEPPAGANANNANKWNAFIDISSDGVNWQAQNPISADVNLIQPSIWETDEGVHAFMRSDAGAVYRSDSTDGGVSWNRAYGTNLPNNNSGLDAVYVSGGLYVVYNPVKKNWGARTPLVISKSGDNGKTWSETAVLEDSKGEYSYPSIIEADGFLHVVYTYRRESVMYAKLSFQASADSL